MTTGRPHRDSKKDSPVTVIETIAEVIFPGGQKTATNHTTDHESTRTAIDDRISTTETVKDTGAPTKEAVETTEEIEKTPVEEMGVKKEEAADVKTDA